ncbi:hypothetical protein H5410_052585 [Solanum commersonii]|uniref:DUF1985 domain-containing protein n=1 Tax=Solanum commersonii TaxID=4109 RepID=A0A9J5X411_SOLCO|nr:hypothetical protein H5410_052585 [Solanum commersonii]
MPMNEKRIRTQRQKEEEELENTNLKKSIEEEEEEGGGGGEHEIDVSSTSVERDDRAVDEEQDDIAIPEKETSPIVESSPLSPSPDNFIVKSIRYANYNLESMIDRTILEEQKLVKFFRSSIFDLLYSYKISNEFSLPTSSPGMPICFGMKEFVIITGLNCHNEEVYDGENMSTKTKMRRKEILEVVGSSCKRNELIELLQPKILVKILLCGKDVNIIISKNWILLSANRKAFSAYLWDRISYDTTIKHLLKVVKTIDGRLLIFMVFHGPLCVGHLRLFLSSKRKYKLLATNNKLVNINELFDLPQDSIVHPWIILTYSEMEMKFFTKFCA